MSVCCCLEVMSETHSHYLVELTCKTGVSKLESPYICFALLGVCGLGMQTGGHCNCYKYFCMLHPRGSSRKHHELSEFSTGAGVSGEQYSRTLFMDTHLAVTNCSW